MGLAVTARIIALLWGNELRCDQNYGITLDIFVMPAALLASNV